MNLKDSRVDTALSNIGTEMEIMGVDGEPLTEDINQKPTITLLGQDSNKFRETILRLNRQANDEKAEREEANLTETEEDKAERDNNFNLDLLVDCTVSFSNIDDVQDIRTMYKDFPNIMLQADRYIANRANFIKKPLTVSPSM